MKKTVAILTAIVLASAGAAFAAGNTLPPPAYPQATYQPQPAYQLPAAYAAAPVVYAPAPVVYYTPPPAAYASPYGGYGCDPLFGFVSLIFNFDSNSGHRGHDDGYYRSRGNGGYGHYGNGRGYYRSGSGSGYGHRGSGGGYFRPGSNGSSVHRGNGSGKHGNAR